MGAALAAPANALDDAPLLFLRSGLARSVTRVTVRLLLGEQSGHSLGLFLRLDAGLFFGPKAGFFLGPTAGFGFCSETSLFAFTGGLALCLANAAGFLNCEALLAPLL